MQRLFSILFRTPYWPLKDSTPNGLLPYLLLLMAGRRGLLDLSPGADWDRAPSPSTSPSLKKNKNYISSSKSDNVTMSLSSPLGILFILVLYFLFRGRCGIVEHHATFVVRRRVVDGWSTMLPWLWGGGVGLKEHHATFIMRRRVLE